MTATNHRPWPSPQRPWSVRQDWLELAFLHWPVAASALQDRLPPGLTLQTFDGSAWIGVVPFRMASVRFRFTPAFAPLSNFPEVNLRTYVTAEGKAGVYFFSLDTPSLLAVLLGRWLYHLPYRKARQRVAMREGSVYFESATTAQPSAGIIGAVHPVGAERIASPASLEHFLTERYCFYSTDKAGSLLRCDVEHEPWPLQRAKAELTDNSLLTGLPIEDPLAPAYCHLSRGVSVASWSMRLVNIGEARPCLVSEGPR